MIRRIMMAALVVACVGLVSPPKVEAQNPTRDYVSVSNAAVYSVPVGTWKNGTLDTVNIWRCQPTNATLTVSQVYTVGAVTVTSTVGTVTGALGTGNGSAVISNAYLIPGDLLLFQFSGATTGTVSYVRRVGN